MKKAITVIGVEAEGIRGIRLEENKAEWVVADCEFWSTTGNREQETGNTEEGGPTSSSAGGGGESDGTKPVPPSEGEGDEQSPEDGYAATVDALKSAAKRFGTHEVVLSMPLKSLLVKVSRTSVEDRDRLPEMASEEIGAVSPFPDEAPVTGTETVAETDQELVSVFAALPETGAAEIGDALDEAKVRVLRTDVTALGWLRTLWPLIFGGTGNGERGTGNGDAPTLDTQLVTLDTQPSTGDRKVVLMDFDDGWDMAVLDEGAPSLLRGLGRMTDPAELGREVMLSLLRAGVATETKEIVIFSKTPVDEGIVERLSQLAPVRSVPLMENGDSSTLNSQLSTLNSFGGVEGVARRTQEGSSLDVTPADWTELRTEARFKKKLFAFLAVAAAGWVLLMGVLFGVPFVYGQMTERQKTLSNRHKHAYKEVREMRDKVKLVQQSSDHARGSLEMLKAVSDRMPEGVTLTSFAYRRGESLSIAGEAQQPTDVYEFKNALTEAVTEDDEKLFAEVTLKGPSQSRGGVHKFSIDGSFVSEEEGK